MEYMIFLWLVSRASNHHVGKYGQLDVDYAISFFQIRTIGSLRVLCFLIKFHFLASFSSCWTSVSTKKSRTSSFTSLPIYLYIVIHSRNSFWTFHNLVFTNTSILKSLSHLSIFVLSLKFYLILLLSFLVVDSIFH